MIWVIGDSFTARYRTLPDSWLQKTATLLNQDVVSFDRGPTCLEYTYHKYRQIEDRIPEKDIVIIGLTNIYERRWSSKILNDEEKKAAEYYNSITDYSDARRTDFLLDFLVYLRDTTVKKNNHTIVFPSDDGIMPAIEDKCRQDFPELHIAYGNFVQSSLGEFSDEFGKEHGFDWVIGRDVRTNHFIRSNHAVIVDKVVNNITKKEPIDFRTGLRQNFLDMELLNDPDFIRDELFSGFMARAFNIHINKP